MTALFITATGTDIGKTFVTAGLIREARRRGQAVEALKPVISGFDPARPEGSDSAILLRALGRQVSPDALNELSPWRFAAPLAPDLAAAREGRSLDVAALIAFTRRAAPPDVLLLIEGVGGIMVPLDAEHTVLDWMAALAIPTLLVAGSYLGTISHSLTALDVLRRRGIAVAALVVSESAGSGVTLADTIATLARFAGPVEVVGLPRLAGAPDHPAFGRVLDLLVTPALPLPSA